jgi:hypothetical protein
VTATLDDVTKKIRREPAAEAKAAGELVRAAREQGLSLTGPFGAQQEPQAEAAGSRWPARPWHASGSSPAS